MPPPTTGKSQFAGKPETVRTCAGCRKTFLTRDPRQRYCDPACNHRIRSRRHRQVKKASS